MDKQTKTLLQKFGFRIQAFRGDALRDVYQDQGVRPEYRLIDDRRFVVEGRKRVPNPNQGNPISVRDALQSLVDEGEIDTSWLEGVA